MQQVDDPPFLPVGTEVSAKYKGAFCEAKVRKVVRNIKCKVAYKQGLGSGTVSDELIKGVLRVGATVEVKHPDKREYVEATITKIQDCSQYTVVFDDGDITTLRRTALCLKSGRHFNESETLDQLPLTHPEHFGNPVIGGRRGRRSRHLHDDSSEDEDDNDSKEVVNEKEEHIGKVVCVESTETKKKDKEKWFPALVVSPTAQVTVRIRVKDEYLVRSFKDGRYYTVPKKEATEFTRDMAAKQDGAAVQAALQYLDNSTLPAHWDKDALFGLANSSSEYEGEFDSDSSDDEPREEKDHFVAQLYKYMDDRGTPLNKVPSITNRDVDLYRLFRAVQKLGGYNRVTSQNQWKAITMRLGFVPVTVSVTNLVKQAYKKFLQPFEEFNRKLGCSMSMTPRNANRSKGRSLVRANSVASPKPEPKEQKPVPAPPPPASDEIIENTSESSNEVSKSKRKLSTGSGKVKAMVEKFEEKVKEEPPEAPSKASKSVVKEETTTASTSVPSSASALPVKKEKNSKKVVAIPPEEKKPNRKKKDSEVEKTPTITDVPLEKDKESDFTIDVGDRLSVYYHEQKVTYEAKVIEKSVQHGVQLYLVHYTGWNNRYDEWVRRDRIAENLTANRSKRGKGSSSTQKAASNVPPNDGTKGATSSAEKLSGMSVTTLTTSMPSNKAVTVSKRGRGRSDSGPPRSMTPSSIVSNTSRTKSPAATANRRTTRGQPSTSRRASNNVSDISMQTDSDSDSDSPVKKTIKPPTTQTSSATSSPGAPSNTKVVPSKSTTTNSQSETEEEEMPPSSAKGRDYDLNQIRSELKGFKELKSPSPESESSTQAGGSEKKSMNVFDFDMSEDLGKKQLLSSLIPKSSTESKSSSMELSSETDSFGDDDSQSSDKTTMLENMTEKFQQKIALDKRLERMNSGGSDKISLKTSSIEKIIEESLAEKMQESMKSKPFVMEKSLFKPVECEVKKEISIPEAKSSIQERKSVRMPTPIEKKQSELPDVKPPVSKFEKKVVQPIDSIMTLVKKEQPLVKKELPISKKEPPMVEPISSEKVATESSVLSSSADVYEFKEPEPFEFEARKSLTSSLNAPDAEKKLKKIIPKTTTELLSDSRISQMPALAGKKIKKSPVKDPDKTKLQKIEEKLVMADGIPPVHLTPVKTENTFDALRKSPSFNLNVSTTGEDNGQSMQETGKPFTEPTENHPPLIASSGETSKNMQYISPFFETSKETPKAFDLKADVSAIESPDKSAKATELEQVKRVLALDPVALNFEPLKVDKSKVSIADKVLKVLNQQKQEEQKPKEEERPLCPPVIEAPQISSFTLTEPPKIELPAIIKKEIEIPLKRAILSSPEQKLDILESIAPKNNDLSETIQKLESVIGNRPVVDHFDEDSSDSTDSEERLVIEDDSQSSETNQTDIVCDVDAAKKSTVFGEENLFMSSKESAFKACTPSNQPSMFSSQPSIIAPATLSVDHNISRPDPESSLFKPIEDPSELKHDNPVTDLLIPLTSFAIKKEELSPNLDASSITHNEAINLLLCEETIPGSPAPSKESSEIKPSTHPIDSDIKHIPMDIECSTQAPYDDLSSADKVKVESNTPISSPRDSMSQDDSSEDLRKIHGQDVLTSPKKRRHTRKHSECAEPMAKRRRHNTNISKRNNGSDSDDNSDANISQRSNRSSRPCQYNFTVELDPNMNPNQRIAILNKTIAELRNAYNMIKAELASIDRRRKKLRRREREKKMQQKINS